MSLVRLEQRDEVAVVWLARPDKRNALTPEMFDELRAALWRARATPALVLAGDGPVFCGGFDLRLCHEQPGTTARLLGDLSAAIVELNARDHPVVIAAHGAAIAGGAALLGAADVAVGEAGGQYGYPVVRLGLSPAVSFPFLRQMTGDGAARELMLDPGLIDGREAHRRGLLHELVEAPGDVLERALAIARALAAKPAHAFAATKRLLRELAGAEHNARAALDASVATADTPDSRERLAAMFTKQ